jgi:AraC-like DNA-binding protein
VTPCWQAGDACVTRAHQPALVLAFAQDRELSQRAVLAGTGLDGWDAGEAPEAITPLQYLRLLANVAGALDSSDTSFLLGQLMLPGHYGAVSHALLQASTLREAIATLLRFPVTLCPTLTPRLAEEDGLAVIYWTDSFGTAGMRGFAVEMQMTAVSAMCRWLSGERLPWRYCFNRTPPRYTEQYEVHLGPRLHFNCHLDALVIDAAWLDRPWPRGNRAGAAAALQAAEAMREPRALLAGVHDYLLEHVRQGPTLEDTAGAFQVSPATLKRHLARHGSHFQAELDQVRTHVALRLMRRGEDNDAVARHLGFHDATNFRRSFKRWTGMTPLLLRAGLHFG